MTSSSSAGREGRDAVSGITGGRRLIPIDSPEYTAPAASQPIPRDLVKEIAMDIGKELAAYIEYMYPDAVKAASSTFLLSVRNCTYNAIMAALETTDEAEIRRRLETHKAFRRKHRAFWKKHRETDWEAVRNAKDVTP